MTNVKGVGPPPVSQSLPSSARPRYVPGESEPRRLRARHAAGSDEVHLTYQSRLSLSLSLSLSLAPPLASLSLSLASPRSFHASRSLPAPGLLPRLAGPLIPSAPRPLRGLQFSILFISLWYGIAVVVGFISEYMVSLGEIGSRFGNGSPRCNLFPDSVMQVSFSFSPPL
jgi:hypothetical protein